MLSLASLRLAAAVLVAGCLPVHASVITGTATYGAGAAVSLENRNVTRFNNFGSATPVPLQSVTDGPRIAYAAAIAPGPLSFAVTGGFTTDTAAVANGNGQITYDFQTGADAPRGAKVVLSTSGLVSLSLVGTPPRDFIYTDAEALVRLFDANGAELFRRRLYGSSRQPDPLADD